MINVSENRTALVNLSNTFNAIETLDDLIEFTKQDKQGPIYLQHTYHDHLKIQMNRDIARMAFRAQRQHLVNYLADLGINYDLPKEKQNDK